MSSNPILWFYGEREVEEYQKIIDSELSDGSKLGDIDSSEVERWIQLRRNFWESEDPFSFKISLIDDLSSHMIMKLLCAANEKIISYVIQQETDLFMRRIRKFYESSHILMSILKLLFMGDVVYDRKHEVYSFAWFWVSQIVFQQPEFDIKNGWVNIRINTDPHIDKSERYAFLDTIIASVFKNMLRESFSNYKEITPSEDIEPYRIFSQFIFSDVTELIDLEKSVGEIDAILKASPMCIVNLDALLQREGIGYDLVLQLSLYMKSFFSLNDLILYFWSRDIRNRIYPSAQDFIDDRPDLRYHFEHQYGGGSSGINYYAMGCRSSRDRGFCFFMNSPLLIREVLSDIYIKDKKDIDPKSVEKIKSIITSIEKMVSSRKYSKACWCEWCLRNGNYDISLGKEESTEMKKYISHPLNDYYQWSIKEAIKKKESVK